MKFVPAASLLVLSTALAACSTIGSLPTERLGQATISFANGMPAGTAQLLSDGTTVTLAVAATGLKPGPHGFHLHTTGRCEAPGFTSAGGHLNPAGREHGRDNPAGQHLGDLPNLVANASGSASAEVDLAGTRPAIIEAVFDTDGTAVIIHSQPDDYRTDPTGNAGPRIACGILRAN